MRFTFTPGAGSMSKVVMTGPGRTSTTFPSMPKSASFASRICELRRSPSSSMLMSSCLGACSSRSGGTV